MNEVYDALNSTSTGNVILPPAEKCFFVSPSCVVKETNDSLWYVGVIVSILGSVLSNFGVNTQKYSMIQEIKKRRERPYIKQPLWILGLVMVFLGAVADFGALGFAAQSLITPVGGFTMIANLFFASFWLGEQITRLDLISTFLIIIGIVFIAAFADKSTQCFTLENLKCLYKRKEFVAYAVIIGATVVVTYLAITYVRKRVKHLKELGMTESRSYGRLKAIYPLLCATLSGLIGAQSVLFAKSTIEILKSTTRGQNEFKNFETYLILLAMFIAIFGQIHFLAAGLQEFDAVVIVPIFQCVFVSFSIIGGAAYFGEFRNFSRIQTIMFPIGVIILVCGVLGLTLHKSRTAEEILEGEEDLDGMSETQETEKPEIDPSDSTPSLRPSVSAPASGEAWTDVVRRESVHRFEDFNRMMPFGAMTGRFTPALLFWNEIEGTLFRRHLSNPLFSVEDESQQATEMRNRRSSVPSHPAGRRNNIDSMRIPPRIGDVEKGMSEASLRSNGTRDIKASSFAGVEHLLSSRNLVLDKMDEEAGLYDDDDDDDSSDVDKNSNLQADDPSI